MRQHSTMLLSRLGAVVNLLFVLTLFAGCKTDSLSSEKI